MKNSIIAACIAAIMANHPVLQGMEQQPTLEELGRQNKLVADVTLDLEDKDGLRAFYGIETVWNESIGDIDVEVKPYIYVKKLIVSFINTETKTAFNDDNLCYWPSTVPLSLLMKKGNTFEGFLQIGPVYNESGNMQHDSLATFSKHGAFIPFTEYNGIIVQYNQNDYFTIPMTTTFPDRVSFERILLKKVTELKSAPNTEFEPWVDQEVGIAECVRKQIVKNPLEQENPAQLTYGPQGFPVKAAVAEKKRKFNQVTQKNGIHRTLMNRAYTGKMSSRPFKKQRQDETTPALTQ